MIKWKRFCVLHANKRNYLINRCAIKRAVNVKQRRIHFGFGFQHSVRINGICNEAVCSGTVLLLLLLAVSTHMTLATMGISCHRVCLSVRLSQVSVLLKRLNVGSGRQRHAIVFNAEDFDKIQTGHPQRRRKMQVR